MTTNDIDDAIKYVKREIKTRNDSFLVLSSLNLLNAAVKIEEHKERVGYGFIKPAVSKFIQYCIKSGEYNLIDEISYDKKKKCVYLRCFGIQFSFHNINTNYINPEFLDLISEKSVEWDGVKLQPISLEIYQLAKECQLNNICSADIIKARFQNIKS